MTAPTPTPNPAVAAVATTPPPADVAAEMALARAAHDGGKIDEEASHLDRAVVADRDAFEPRLALAELLLRQGSDLGRAGRLLGEAAAIRPDDVRVDRLHAWLDELQGDDEHAVFRYRRVLAVSPDPELRLHRAVLLERLARHDEALQEFQSVVAERPSDRTARAGMAEIYESRGRIADAELALLDVVRLAPADPVPLRRLAAFYRRNGEPGKAHEAEVRARSLESPQRSLRPLRPSRY